MGNTQEYALTGTTVPQWIRAEKPIANTVFDAGRFYMSWPIADIKMEARVQ